MRRFLSLAILGVVATATQAAAAELSKSIMRPTPISNGVVAGNLPGGEGSASYYIAVDLKQGQLMTQLSISGRANSDKKLTFELLNADARVAASTYVMAGLDAKAETTKGFPIDSSGHYVIRLSTEGKETGTYCVLMGGPAMPNAGDAACPTEAAAVSAPVPPPPPPKPVVAEVRVAPVAPPAVVNVPAAPPAVVAEPPKPRNYEVIVSRCEERLRIGSDFLFDFDRAEVRPEASPALDEIAEHLAKEPHSVMIEGHTDGKGADGYNQTLSERRAIAVRTSLTARGLPISELNIRGYGKSRPVAPNENIDGSDDPEGRQKNRRVEVVINTCQ
jgi:outer membrane protein OmpA-like peptidoglycan-associated protein